MLKRIICTIGTATLLSACDSGGGKSNTTPTDLRTGSFVDSPVAGLSYKTETQSGITDENGQFNYLDGETVEFRIGGIHLGTVNAQEIVTPFSLLGIKPLTSESEIIEILSRDDITSFDRVLNIASLLQTLDSDGQPDNGIDLGEANKNLKKASINLSVKASHFKDQQDFRDILENLGISSSRTFTLAAQHLYEHLDINVTSNLVASVLSGENNTANNLIKYSYNQNELLTSQTTDLNNDGIVDNVIFYIYDDHNRLIETTSSATGITEKISYDDNGKILSKEVTHPQDHLSSYQSYTYANDKLSKLETDLGYDGSIDITTNYRYDESGNLITHQIERSGDTNSVAIKTYTYSGDRVKTITEDNNGDGEPNSLISYGYDASNNILSQSIIRYYNDTTKITLIHFNYDSDNNPIKYVRDDDQDGIPEYIEAYKYNSDGKRTEYKKDLDADGRWDFISQYEYNINGKRTRMVEDSDGNGVADKTWKAEYKKVLIETPWNSIAKKL